MTDTTSHHEAANHHEADHDPYASSRETTEGRVYTVTGGDWEDFLAESAGTERIVMNLG
ncbi:MAG: NADH dehydrogenase subunit D, partial [Sciscionella sp.]